MLVRIAPLLVAAAAAAGVHAQSWSFVSIPDFQNNDIGSLADPDSAFPNNPTLPAGFVALDPLWDSCTADYDDSVDWIVSQLALEQPQFVTCLLYTSPSPRDLSTSRMPSSA